MISYLVDAVLLIALAFTSMRVTRMHRELARLRSYQGEFSTIIHETAGTFDTAIAAARDSTANLGRLASVLSAKIDQAHEAIAALDARRASPDGGAQAGDSSGAVLREGNYQEAISR